MAAVESQMLELGTPAPGFSLPDPDGQLHSLPETASAFLVMFICNHCPFVKHLRGELASHGYEFPYLLDTDQSVAKAYRAACTPDFYVFDGDKKLAYRGQLDASRPGNSVPVDGRDLRAALDALLDGRPVDANQAPSIGCNIKWRPGNEPEYY